MSECKSLHPRFVSPTARGTNRLLWGDWNNGNYGILVRTLDLYDSPIKIQEQQESDPSFEGLNASLLPASFVHASMRAPNVLFNMPEKLAVAGVLVGSHFSKNTILQSHRETMVVDSPVCYPRDAGTNKRSGALQEHGRGCHRDGPAAKTGMCLNRTCMFEPRNNCACQYTQVPSEQFGDFFSTWIETTPGVDKGRSQRYMCWFENSRNGMVEMITASNSYWFARKRWCTFNDAHYRGWTGTLRRGKCRFPLSFSIVL